jgi:hypothetical protein
MRIPPGSFSIGAILIITSAHCGGSVAAGSACPSGCSDAAPAPDAAGPDAGPVGRACTPPAAAQHRATHDACSATRPPGVTFAGDAGVPGECHSDADCTMGKNPRCTYPAGTRSTAATIPTCSSDACTTDADCGSTGVCECGSIDAYGERTPNVCLPSNCQVDGDCGPGGACSPSFDTMCGPSDGVVGYFCHRTADQCTQDECTNDSDCQGDGAAPYCAWEPTAAKWVCHRGLCSG